MNRVWIQQDLEHMGIKGMKWGVRRANRQTETLTKKVAAVEEYLKSMKLNQTALTELRMRLVDIRV